MSTERQTRDSGARVDVDDDGMTPLLVAAVNSQRDLVSKQEKIDALELLGATYVNDKEDLVEALGRPILHYEAKNKKSWLFKSFLFIPRKRFSKKKIFFLAGTGRSEAIYFAL